ncbi:TIGR04282 family arsenosugar biosynthesis glycosyltransferase [Winogradskyella sp. E313]|uniref:TIGR04282 family arsenosugar biosynthesis glycosyltransferase n=1 Tax=Winogradskyella immobilis TaxID=2816852 RepID=A0ABS8EJK5_9FLAO|nr:TIGR04282 family arsenosugar biosynthesis glycosyltransferase [Winogradskyella immobilis]
MVNQRRKNIQLKSKKLILKTKNLIIVLTRNPELGKVKSRLAKSIGKEAALEVYIQLIAHTEKTIRHIDADKAIYYSETIGINDIWDESIYQKYLQTDGDLGERIEKAFKNGFEAGYQNIIIVGSDLYDLAPNHIETAFEALKTYDTVIGPADDGGFYLLGMKTLHSAIFKNKEWGTETVFEATITDLEQYSTYVLESLNDIDYVEDLKPHKEFNYLFSTKDQFI